MIRLYLAVIPLDIGHSLFDIGHSIQIGMENRGSSAGSSIDTPSPFTYGPRLLPTEGLFSDSALVKKGE